MKELVRDLLISLLIVLAVSWMIRPTIVKQNSMQPTLYQNDYLLVNKQAYAFGAEKRGDIIVFKTYMGDSGGRKKLLVKRIIGIPGDIITIKENEVYRNGQKLEEPYTLEGETPGELYNIQVPEGKFFVMGDNRRVSIDSRSEDIGLVSEDAIMGKVFIRLFPFNKIRVFN